MFQFLQVQILGYNSDLYDNETTASKLPHGLTAISVLLQVGDMSNVEMRKITKAARNIRYGGRITFSILTFPRKIKRYFERSSFIHLTESLFLNLGQTAQIRNFSLLKLLPDFHGLEHINVSLLRFH